MPDVLWVDETGKTTVREVDDEGNLVETTTKPEPFAGKGDHDNNGRTGGAAPAQPKHRGRKRR